MLPLTIPPPQLLLDPPGSAPALEKPVNVRVDVLHFADGTELAVGDARVIGLFVYRTLGGSEQMWDETTKTWTVAPGSIADLASFTPVGLAAPGAPPPPAAAPSAVWTGVVVAAGQKDASGSDRFSKATAGSPAYRVRAFATAEHAGQQYIGLSEPSPDLVFVSAADSQRFGATLDPNPKEPTRAHLALKNSAMVEVGYIEIRSVPGPAIEIANCTSSGTPLAVVTLAADGNIHLTPGSGGQVVLHGPLHAETVEFQPSGGGARVLL